MKINIKKCLEFFDNPIGAGHATAVVGVLGEDLSAYAFKHYIERHGGVATILLDKYNEPISVTQGKQKGKRLDRWIEVTENDITTLYQCEIKSWSATAIGGRRLKINSSQDESYSVVDYYWQRQMRTEFLNKEYPTGLTKVLVKMNQPQSHKLINIMPLLIYWMPISNSQKMDPLCTINISDLNNPALLTEFTELKIFSVSLYFRQLMAEDINNEILDFDMPHAEHRMGILNDIMSLKA